MLVDELNERDTVAIVVYAGASGVALPTTTCEKKDVIREAIDRLTPGGSTNGAAGIELAYQLAAERFVAGGVNRVILATDGDFNVGVTSRDDLLKLIEEKAKSRIFLTTLGYGMGNLKDATLEMLADKGNGTYGYVDTDARGPQAPRRGGGRDPRHDREGREGAGRVQPEDGGRRTGSSATTTACWRPRTSPTTRRTPARSAPGTR